MIRLFKSALLFFCIYSMSAAVFVSADVKSDFLSSNPNESGWTVGYLDKENNFVAYNSTFDDGNGIAGWTMDRTPGPRGDVTINYTDQPIDRYGIHWEPGEIIVHSPLIGSGVVVEWNASGSEASSVDMSIAEHTPGAEANIELWSDETKLYDGTVTDITSTDTTSSVSSTSSVDDVLEKTWSLTPNYSSKVKLIILPSEGKIVSHHLGVFLKVNLKSADKVSSASAKFGRHLPTLQAKTSDKRMASKVGSDVEVSVK
jgi:hypothetical protein